MAQQEEVFYKNSKAQERASLESASNHEACVRIAFNFLNTCEN